MRSNHLAWAHYRDGGVTVIENPSAFFNNGSWYLFYSGNSWNTNYYATGIAHCGPKLADGLCRPMPNGRRAWFAYAAKKKPALPPSMRKHRLPGNKRGPGAMVLARLVVPLNATMLVSANADHDGGATLAEVAAYEGKRFEDVDSNDDGWVTEEELRASTERR